VTGQSYPASTLLDRDLARALDVCVPEFLLKDATSVTELAHRIQHGLTGHMVGGCTSCEDGPYSDGRNPEYWSIHYDQVGRGFKIEVDHTVRATDTRTVLREGLVTWRTLAELALDVTVGHDEQLTLEVAA